MDKLKVKTGKDILKQIHAAATEYGVQIYAVGGFVRDLYLGKEGNDIDFVVVGDAIKFAKYFRKKCRTGKVVTYPRFGTAMIHYKDYLPAKSRLSRKQAGKLEFVAARSEHYQPDSRKPVVQKADLRSDLSRRDFTINCLAMDISPKRFGEIIDVFNGVRDIEKKIICTPLDPQLTFSDDPLRMMRAVRFAAQLGFTIEEKTYQAIKKTKDRLSIISQERITEEFKKLLLAPKPSTGLQLLKDTGISAIIFPELDELAGVDQRQDYHHKDVFNHTLQVVDNIAAVTDRFELRLTALLHDIAKPQTKRFVEGIGWTFHGHEELGAKMAERIGRRMKLSNGTVKYVQQLVRLHLRPMQLVNSSVTDSAYRRLMVEAGDSIDDLMMLCRADITSKNPNKVREYIKNFDKVEKRINEVEEKDKLREFKPTLTGNDIMTMLGLSPGPLIGKIKDAVVDAILDGEIPNEYDAAREYLMKIKDQYMGENQDKK